MIQVQISFPGIDLINDVITDDNGTPVNSVPIIEYVVSNPLFAILPTESGAQKLCTIGKRKVDYTITINGTDTITGEEFDILYPGNFSTHPIHRPK